MRDVAEGGPFPLEGPDFLSEHEIPVRKDGFNGLVDLGPQVSYLERKIKEGNGGRSRSHAKGNISASPGAKFARRRKGR